MKSERWMLMWIILCSILPSQVWTNEMRIVRELWFLKTIDGAFDKEQVHMTYRTYPWDNGGGYFVWDANSTETPDDGLIVVGYSGNGRWKRVYEGYISPSWFGALGVSWNDDHWPIQYAFDRPEPVKFDKNYYIQAPVRIGLDGKNVDFNGYQLIGCSTTYQRDAVLEITGSSVCLTNAYINAWFNNYKCGVHWFSIDSSHPSANCRIMGLKIDAAIIGLQYGAFFEDASNDAPMSGNVLYNLTGRNVERVVQMKQNNNSYLMIRQSILDCMPYEWPSYPTYHVFSDQDAKCAEVWPGKGNLTIELSEFVKCTSTVGWAAAGPMRVIDCTIEAPTTWFYVNGDLVLENVIGYCNTTSRAWLELAPSVSGTCRISGAYVYRPVGSIGSTGDIIYGPSADPNYRVWIKNSKFEGWDAHHLYAAGGPALVDATNTEFPNTSDSFGKPFIRRFASGTLNVNRNGTPQGVIAAPVGSQCIRTNGGVGTSLYIKELGTGTTGWRAK